MARIKGGMNARRKPRIEDGKGLQRRKIQAVSSGKAVRDESAYQLLRRKKAEKETVPSALDRAYQRGGENERTFLQQIHVWSEAG